MCNSKVLYFARISKQSQTWLAAIQVLGLGFVGTLFIYTIYNFMQWVYANTYCDATAVTMSICLTRCI